MRIEKALFVILSACAYSSVRPARASADSDEHDRQVPAYHPHELDVKYVLMDVDNWFFLTLHTPPRVYRDATLALHNNGTFPKTGMDLAAAAVRETGAELGLCLGASAPPAPAAALALTGAVLLGDAIGK